MDMYEISVIIESVKKKLDELYLVLNLDALKEQLIILEEQMAKQNFWENKEQAQLILNNAKNIKGKIQKYNAVMKIYEDTNTAYELVNEHFDEALNQELNTNISKLKMCVEELEVYSLLTEEYDNLNAIVTIHAGAGGTESQDWAQMLLRMYQKWLPQTNFEYEMYDITEGDEAGIKSVTFGVKGLYAYGYMKCEKGVHRLVRISPFDSAKRRHTSFAAIDVMPEIDDTINIEIAPEELETDTYRASGAGGQHVNKTESAVRIKHIPTGIVVSCQTERSQVQNRETCMKMLRAKLYQYELNKTQEKLKEIKGELSENGWGSQIRSYVFCPYTMVKDHRTNYEVGNVDAVMNGNIFEFIYAQLKLEKAINNGGNNAR